MTIQNVNYKEIAENLYAMCYNETVEILQDNLSEDEDLYLPLSNGVISIPNKIEKDGETFYEKQYIEKVKCNWCGDILIQVDGKKWIKFDFDEYPHLIVKLNEIIKKTI